MTHSAGLDEPISKQAGAIVDAWKRDKQAVLTCFVCDGGPLQVTDASVRPYAEWYLLDCAGCGERIVFHRPTGRPRFAEEA